MRRDHGSLWMGILVIALLGACNGIQQCLDFEDRTAGEEFTVGTSFQTSSTDVAVEQFQWENGAWATSGSLRIDDRNYALGSGLDLNARNATMSPALQFPVQWITFRFGELGGNTNLRVNSEFVNVPDLIGLDGTTVGGTQVLIDYIPNGNNVFGRMLLYGLIDDFAIGGQELWIDDVWSLSTSTQPAPRTWARSYGGPGRDQGWSIQPTMDGGYLMAGSTRSFSSQTQLWIVKLDLGGAVLWQAMYEPTHTFDSHAHIAETADGGIVVAHAWSDGAHVLRLDAFGAPSWSRSYQVDSYTYLRSMKVAADGSMFLSGSMSNPDPSIIWVDGLVMHVAANGDVDWCKRLATDDGIEQFLDVHPTADGGCVASGVGPESHAWIVKLDASGASDWQRSMTAPNRAHAISVLQTVDGGYLVTGRMEAGDSSNSNALLLRLDPSGNVLWQRRYGNSVYETAMSAVETPTGAFVIGGAIQESGQSMDFWLFKVNGSGDLLWQRRYGGTGPEFCKQIAAALDGGYVMTGDTSSFGAGDVEAWVVKVASDGSIASPCSLYASTNRTSYVVNDPGSTTNVLPVDVNTIVTQLAVTATATQGVVNHQCPGN